MLKILTAPEETEILRRKSEPILKFDEELAEFLRELGKTLKGQKDPAGVGLSAIQVGNPIRVFATFLSIENTGSKGPTFQGRTLEGRTLSKKPELVFYINPEITGHAEGMTLGQELTVNREQRTASTGIHRPSSIVPVSSAGIHRPFLEGCLSIPRIYGPVLRWPWIKAKATVFYENDLSLPSAFNLQPSTFSLSGLTARVFQHELDHLNGILFTDRVLAQGNKLYSEEGREMVEMEI